MLVSVPFCDVTNMFVISCNYISSTLASLSDCTGNSYYAIKSTAFGVPAFGVRTQEIMSFVHDKQHYRQTVSNLKVSWHAVETVYVFVSQRHATQAMTGQSTVQQMPNRLLKSVTWTKQNHWSFGITLTLCIFMQNHMYKFYFLHEISHL